jgi:DNA-binding NarL/FixJ family response regulator
MLSTHGMITARYRAVLGLALEGFGDEAIARHLGIGEAAVRVRWERLYQLLRVPPGAGRRERAIALWSQRQGTVRG